MKTWYITPSNNIVIDTDNEDAKIVDDNYTSINSCYIASEDCKIKFTDSKTKGWTEYEVKKGQIVLTFYSKEMPNQLVILDSKEFLENLNGYREAMQKEKEEWASKKCCGDCCESCKPEN